MYLIDSQRNEMLESLVNFSQQPNCLGEWLTADLVPRLFFVFLIIGILCLFVYLIYRSFSSFNLNKKKERVYQRRITWLSFLIIYVAGYILYFIGFFEAGTSKSIAIIVRPLMASLGMFFLDNNFQELNSQCLDDPIYMSFFAAINFCAIIFTIAFIIYSFWKRLWSWCKSWWWIFKARFFKINDEELYIFFGFSEQNILLANSIDNVEHIIFVALPKEHTNESHTNLTSFLASLFVDYDNDKLDRISGLNYVLKFASINPADDKDIDQDVSDIKNLYSRTLKKWNLHSLDKHFKYHKKVSVFFMSDREEDNVLSAMNFINTSIYNIYPEKEIFIYCHARRNRKNLILQSLIPPNSKMRIKLIDSSYLAVKSLRFLGRKEKGMPPVYYSHPINFVNAEKGYVSSTFTAMIIGFGETGSEVLKFIYEFGSFVGEAGKKTSFKCYCLDEEMETKKNDFFLEVPYAQTLEAESELEFLNYSYNDDRFHALLTKSINDLNYVVITVGDNDQSYQMAFDIIDFAKRYRKAGFKNFHVFMHEKVKANALNLKAVNVYNFVPYYNAMGEHCANDSVVQGVVSLFGSPEAIFYKTTVIGDERTETEKESFGNDYREQSSTINKTEVPVESDPYVTFINSQKVYRGENQRESNSLHKYTKQVISKIKKSSDVERVEKDNALIERLARLEHQRWMSNMYMGGYLLMDKSMEEEMEEKKLGHSSAFVKVHSTLVDYDSLSEQYKDNDRRVVKRSLAELKKYYNE